MFSLLMTFLTTRNNNTRRFHSILNTFRFFLLIRGSPQKTLILVVKSKSSVLRNFQVWTPLSSYYNRRQKNQIMGLTSRREKIVLFGDSLTQRAIEQGGWGESLVRRREFIFISFFFSFIITQSYVFSFFACLCWCFLFLNLIAARLEFCREEEV